MRGIRWMDWTNLVLGLYLLCVPLFTTNSSNGATIWVAEVGGAAVVLLAIWALAQPAQSAPEWSQAVAGVLVLASPFMFSYTELTGAAWNAYMVGVAVALLALSALPVIMRENLPAPAQTHERLNS